MCAARYGPDRALWKDFFAPLAVGAPAKTYHPQVRARGTGHQAALRQLANRWVGILHGCLKHGNTYDEHTAWSHILNTAA